VEGPLDALSHRRNGEGLFFLQREGDGLELLNQRIAWLVFVEGMFTTCGWPARFTLDPLPDLGGSCRICVHNQMLMGRLCGLLLDLPSRGVIGDCSVRVRTAGICDHTTFFRYGLERVRRSIDNHVKLGSVAVPAEFF